MKELDRLLSLARDPKRGILTRVAAVARIIDATEGLEPGPAVRAAWELLHDLVRPALIGREQQAQAGGLRRKHARSEYERLAREQHAKDPAAFWKTIQLRVALHLGVDPSTVRKNVGKRPW